MRYLLSALLVCVAISPSLAEEPPADFFPIMAYDHMPNDPAVLEKVRACGFTVAGFVAPETLDACQAAGLKAIVFHPATYDYDWQNVDAEAARARVAKLAARVKDHPAVYGYYLRDEPNASYFPGLAIVADAVKTNDPGAWPYMNLFPNYANAGQLGSPSYDAHIEQFIKTCDPPILSYDHYALLEGGDLRESYFANLESMRRASVAHDIPFWNIVLSSAHFNYREPTPADFRFQAFTSLAYGARGLAYFQYFTPDRGNYRMGPIDQFGHETPTWDALRNVNLQVARLAPTLLKLHSQRAYHFGTVPQGCHAPGEESFIKAIGGPLLVGDFIHDDGTHYVMIVNRDVTASVPCAPQFREPVKTLQRVSSFTGNLLPFAGENVWLAPGQGMLLKVTR